jgi:hypothetical protein
MPSVAAMANAHDQQVRTALRRLSAERSSSTIGVDVPLPLLIRAPYVAVMWAVALATVMATLALGHIHVPYTARGVAVAVGASTDSVARDSVARDSLTLLLVLPPSARDHVRLGQLATLDTGGTSALDLPVTLVERELLDAPAARRRFREPASLLAQLEAPKLVVRLARCHADRCLTPHAGSTYAATTQLGTRTLASYAVPRS